MAIAGLAGRAVVLRIEPLCVSPPSLLLACVLSLLVVACFIGIFIEENNA